MSEQLSSSHFQLCNIPLQIVILLPFVVQSVIIAWLVDYLSNSHWAIWIYGSTLILSFGFSIIIARWISQPILELNRASNELIEGKLQFPVAENSQIIEISLLAKSFNQISTWVNESVDRLAVVARLKESELALTQSLNQLNYLIENSPLATIRWNQRFQVEYWSKQAEEMFGWKAEEVLGKTMYDWQFIFEDDLEHVNHCAAQLLNGMYSRCENRNYHKDGSIVYCEWYNSTLVNESGNLISILSLAQDISDRKQAEIALAEVGSSLRIANQELQTLVNLDGLTQIANRRCFDERVIYEWQRLYRDRQPLSLLMFDVDYFKRYNDYYGHQLGDQALLLIAQAVDQLVCRPADLVARYGGEEFIVILPNTNLDGAIAVAKNLHKAIADLQIPHQDSGVSDVVTVSMGIASDIPQLDRSPYVLINQADQALYYAKQQGRNRSVIFTE